MRKIKISKKRLVIGLILLAMISAFFIYKFVVMDDARLVDETAKTTSNEKSAQSDFQSSESRKPVQPTAKPGVSVNDTSGSAQSNPTSTPLVSQDGVITVYSPTNNGLFASGTSLTGKASVSKVSYRLIDNVSGVTATGDLAVTNGRFSGEFSFNTNASEGRLDVFTITSGGVEKSIIEIPVRFR